MKVFLCLSILFYATVDSSLVPFIQPCHASDKACLKSSAQSAVPIIAAGIPSLNMLPLDPMYIDSVVANQAGLQMNFRNTVVNGLRNCKVENLRRAPTKTFLKVKCSVDLAGDYTLDGKLLVLDIHGQGQYKIEIRDIVVKMVFDIGEQISGGDRHWKVQGFRHNVAGLGHVQYQFSNLFNGNTELADQVQSFANSNWRDIFDEMAPPIVDVVVDQVVKETTKLFDQVPIRDLAYE